jgi:hypothetical protein
MKIMNKYKKVGDPDGFDDGTSGLWFVISVSQLATK